MSEPFVGEIRIFAGNYAPENWALCDGSLLPMRQYSALFSLLGTFYGGDGITTFALPNLQGSVPLGQGQGPNLSPYVVGQAAGVPNVTLVASEIAQHTHTLNAGVSARANTTSATNNVPGGIDGNTPLFASGVSKLVMNPHAISSTQGGPHENMQPYLCLTFIIALQGIFPSRA
jgi:microcystin-dependent protein